MNTNDTSFEQAPTIAKKKPYEKPSFRFEHVFVTTALSCSKAGTEGQCPLSLSAS